MKPLPYLSTYMRVLLNDWPELARLMQAHASPLVGGTETESSAAPAKTGLSEKQIEDALAGPYASFFRQKLAAYAIYARINMAVLAKEDNPLKNATEKYELAAVDEAIKAVQLNPSRLQILTPANMQKIKRDIDTLVARHFEGWQTQMGECYQEIYQALKREKIALSDAEQAQLCADEPISEMKDRYADLNLPWPKLKKSGQSIAEYIQLKVYLAIQSALSRQQLPHGREDLQKIEKRLKSNYKKIAEIENDLLAQQEKETDAIVVPLKLIIK